jgi:hypothetical protein
MKKGFENVHDFEKARDNSLGTDNGVNLIHFFILVPNPVNQHHGGCTGIKNFPVDIVGEFFPHFKGESGGGRRWFVRDWECSRLKFDALKRFEQKQQSDK